MDTCIYIYIYRLILHFEQYNLEGFFMVFHAHFLQFLFETILTGWHRKPWWTPGPPLDLAWRNHPSRSYLDELYKEKLYKERCSYSISTNYSIHLQFLDMSFTLWEVCFLNAPTDEVLPSPMSSGPLYSRHSCRASEVRCWSGWSGSPLLGANKGGENWRKNPILYPTLMSCWGESRWEKGAFSSQDGSSLRVEFESNLDSLCMKVSVLFCWS